MAAEAQQNSTVTVHYTCKHTDGKEFDTSYDREPLTFTLGSGQVIKGFEDGILGMKIGEKRTVNIPCLEAYGQRRDDMVMEYPKSDFPADMQPVVGLELHMSDNQANVFPVVIKEVKEDVVVLDANHPLADCDLIFDIELVAVA